MTTGREHIDPKTDDGRRLLPGHDVLFYSPGVDPELAAVVLECFRSVWAKIPEWATSGILRLWRESEPSPCVILSEPDGDLYSVTAGGCTRRDGAEVWLNSLPLAQAAAIGAKHGFPIIEAVCAHELGHVYCHAVEPLYADYAVPLCEKLAADMVNLWGFDAEECCFPASDGGLDDETTADTGTDRAASPRAETTGATD